MKKIDTRNKYITHVINTFGTIWDLLVALLVSLGPSWGQGPPKWPLLPIVAWTLGVFFGTKTATNIDRNMERNECTKKIQRDTQTHHMCIASSCLARFFFFAARAHVSARDWLRCVSRYIMFRISCVSGNDEHPTGL